MPKDQRCDLSIAWVRRCRGCSRSKAASIEGYAYSSDLKALAAQGFVWDENNLDKYLENPKQVAAKGKMVFPGLKDEQDRKDVIAYLKTFSK
jgi:cytochrome c